MKDPEFRSNRIGVSISGFKGPLCALLCGLLLAQPVAGAAQEAVVQKPQPSAIPIAEISSSSQPATPFEELPSAPVPQASLQQPQQQQSQPAPQPNTPTQQNQPVQQPNTPQQTNTQPNTPQQQNMPQQPVGTAAAPYEKPTGVAGSRPAGAAIAPAKQRRVRAIVISLGLILAGAGAIGAVAGMSKASHSQP